MEPDNTGRDAGNVQGQEAHRGLTREELLRRAARGAFATGAFSALGGLGGVASAAAAGASAVAAAPKRGGTLQVGASLAGPAYPALDANTTFGWSTDARTRNLYDKLVEFGPDASTIVYSLAEEFTPEKADTWLIRLRPGVTFHNGKPLTADDVIYTFQRWANPKLATIPGGALPSLDPHRSAYTKMDKYTVRVKLKAGTMAFRDVCTSWTAGIVPVGYDPKTAIGSGPFMLKSYTPGQQSTMVRNPNYWQTGLPYVDELVVTDFADPTARTNALLSGQVHAADFIPFGSVAQVAGTSGLKLLVSHPGQWIPFTMRVDKPPFNDPRVRAAMRLLVDRPQMIATAVAGHGRLGNDISSILDPSYDHALPQRHQDIAQAKALLKQAGHSSLKVDLYTTEASAGMVESATVFAQQAAAGGVTINVHKVDSSVLYGPNYTKWAFAMDFWGSHKYLYQIGLGQLPGLAENETHWPDAQDKARYLSLYRQASNTVNDAARTQLIHEMMTIDYQRGGYIIPHYVDYIDGYSTKIAGLRPNNGELPLDYYTFKHVYFV